MPPLLGRPGRRSPGQERHAHHRPSTSPDIWPKSPFERRGPAPTRRQTTLVNLVNPRHAEISLPRIKVNKPLTSRHSTVSGPSATRFLLVPSQDSSANSGRHLDDAPG